MDKRVVYIEGYGNKYTIDTTGEIISYCKKNPIIRKPHINTSGYLHVRLIANGKDISVSIHVLIAKAFIPNPENLATVNHIDGNKLNNCIENLEWCSHSDNQKHAYKTGLRLPKKGADNFKAKLSECKVLAIRKSEVKVSKLAEIFNVSESSIYRIKQNKGWTHVSQ